MRRHTGYAGKLNTFIIRNFMELSQGTPNNEELANRIIRFIKNWIIWSCDSSVLIGLATMVYGPLYYALHIWSVYASVQNWKLQWATKVLTHFRKMGPFCIVEILIPFPCLPQPLAPKINVEFWTLKSFFYFRQHWFGGSGDLRRLKGMK